MTSAAREGNTNSDYTRSMDYAVQEVFSLMMGIECAGAADCLVSETETISAVIGLAGAISGTCVLRSGGRTAVRMAGALIGMEMLSLDDTVKDAIGEICNMIAGAWKAKIPALAAHCMLSTPTVITGTHYRLHTHRPELRLERCYRFDEFTFALILACECQQQNSSGAC